MEGEMVKANAKINLYKDNKNQNDYKQKINWYKIDCVITY